MKRFDFNTCKIPTPLILAANIAALPLSVAFTASTAVASVDAPVMEQGIQFGDLAPGHAIVWSRADRPARMMVEYAFNERFDRSQIIRGPYALEASDFTARQDLTGLPDGKDVYVKVWFEELTNSRNKSASTVGHFHTIGKHEDIRFVWGGDTAGQG